MNLHGKDPKQEPGGLVAEESERDLHRSSREFDLI